MGAEGCRRRTLRNARIKTRLDADRRSCPIDNRPAMIVRPPRAERNGAVNTHLLPNPTALSIVMSVPRNPDIIRGLWNTEKLGEGMLKPSLTRPPHSPAINNGIPAAMEMI